MTHYSTRPKRRKKNPVFTKVQQKTAAYTVQLSSSHTHTRLPKVFTRLPSHTHMSLSDIPCLAITASTFLEGFL